MTHNLYIIVAVFLRLAGLWFIVVSAFSMFLMNFLGSSLRGPGAGFSLLPTLLPLIGGVALWLCARPVARAVTANLE